MLSSGNAARQALAPRTNLLHTQGPQSKLTSFLQPISSNQKLKRRFISNDHQPQKKRPRVEAPWDSDSEETDGEYEDDDDVTMEDAAVIHARMRTRTPFISQSGCIVSSGIHPRKFAPSTLPILKSFVSSHKSDVFKCQSIGNDTYLTPPYACSYSHSSKRGGVPYLAVATEQGTLHILNTTKRKDWDVEPQRTTFQPHNNGIFDVKWSPDDTNIATCSGDQSTRITELNTGSVTHALRGHTSTVKCTAWDPTHKSLLATGGRDGAICLWDLRIGKWHENGDAGVVLASPVVTIHGSHDDMTVKSKPKMRKGKQMPATRSVTSLLYPDYDPYGLVSSGSFDGILRYWDLRKPMTSRKSISMKPTVPTELFSSSLDPTILHGSRRPRGIISLASGTGPTARLLFAIGADSRIHTYDLPTLTPQTTAFHHGNLLTNSFYVDISVSPCGRWLACGGSGTKGNSFLFDVENACRPFMPSQPGVELLGKVGEVGAVDWARDTLATCTDDGTVRIWRPDVATHRLCQSQPEECQWEWTWAS